jgi:hypothetical protein
VIVSELTGFILSCLDEDERDARLFHEFTCPAEEQQARDGFPGTWCRCPVPAQILARVQVTRDIIAGCGRQLRRPGSGAPGVLPAAAAGIPKILGAIALSYEQDPRWQEQWRP